jgi:hypothetical protein
MTRQEAEKIKDTIKESYMISKTLEVIDSLVEEKQKEEQPKKISKISVNPSHRINACNDFHKELTVLIADAINRIIDHLNGEVTE